MARDALTDDRIAGLLREQKLLKSSPTPKVKVKGKHEERDFKFESADGVNRYTVYTRQNTKMRDDFSCGLVWEIPNEEPIHLMRANGSSHAHPNVLEGTKLPAKCHVHVATERYIDAGRQPEGFAEECGTYSDLDGALRELVKRCNLVGIDLDTSQLPLFSGSE